MTTRKALIERIQSMQLGTQEMLDAAKDDAEMIPFDTLFFSIDGFPLWRTGGVDDERSVYMGGSYYSSKNLTVITEE